MRVKNPKEPQESQGEGAKKEAQKMRYNANQANDKKKESSRRMLAMCEESREAEVRTLVDLDAQDEQGGRIEGGMENILKNLRDAERSLKGINICCNVCSVPCNRRKEDDWSENEGPVVKAEPEWKTNRRLMKETGEYVGRVTSDEPRYQDLDQMNNSIGMTRNMAVDANSAYRSQNKRIDNLNTRVDISTERIQAARERAQKLVKERGVYN